MHLNVLDPTYKRKTYAENRTSLNLWLLGNNRRDAVSFRRLLGRIKDASYKIL